MKVIYTVLLIIWGLTVRSQSSQPAEMTRTLASMQLEYLSPIEELPRYLPSGKIKYFDYDFGLEIDNGNTTVLVQTQKDDGNYIPQIMITALVATLATNKQDVEISMISPSDSYLSDTNSDWAIESLFTPKDNMGDYQIAHLKSMFREGIGVINILYLGKAEVNVKPLLRFRY